MLSGLCQSRGRYMLSNRCSITDSFIVYDVFRDEMMLTMSRGKEQEADPYKKMYEEAARDVRDLEKQKTVVCDYRTLMLCSLGQKSLSQAKCSAHLYQFHISLILQTLRYENSSEILAIVYVV